MPVQEYVQYNFSKDQKDQDQYSNEKATVFSIIPNLLIKQQDTFSVLKDTTLKSYTLRSADENLLFVRKLLLFHLILNQ